MEVALPTSTCALCLQDGTLCDGGSTTAGGTSGVGTSLVIGASFLSSSLSLFLTLSFQAQFILAHRPIGLLSLLSLLPILHLWTHWMPLHHLPSPYHLSMGPPWFPLLLHCAALPPHLSTTSSLGTWRFMLPLPSVVVPWLLVRPAPKLSLPLALLSQCPPRPLSRLRPIVTTLQGRLMTSH